MSAQPQYGSARAMTAAAIIAVILGLGVALNCEGQRAKPEPPGIAVLASGVGSTYPVQALTGFVEAAETPLVVVDWAWITAHWDRTDFAKVNELVDALQANGVQVAAMYRPRFLGEPTVPIQVKEDGSPVLEPGREICFSSEEARQWGIEWGSKILTECPGFPEIIIYNPRNSCQCVDCRKAAEADPFAHYAAIWRFLEEARTAWRAVRPDVKLGVVFAADPEFWSRGVEVVDAAHPFLYWTEQADLAGDMRAARAVGDALPGKLGACLAKITWAPEDKVSPQRLAEFGGLATAYDLRYFVWTFDTLFLSELYDPAGVCRALGLDGAAVNAPLASMRGAAASTGPQPKRYTATEIDATDAEAFFQKLARPEQGYHQFAAMWALMYKAQTSGEETTTRILQTAIALAQNPRAPLPQRWQSLYVAGGTNSDGAIAPLVALLRSDPNEIIRSVAACALGGFESPDAIEALEEAARRETSERVLESVNKALGGAFLNTAVPAPAAEQPEEEDVEIGEVLVGKRVAIVLVKDFMRMENTGPVLADVEFERYFPAVGSEQIVLARWLTAASDSGQELPLSVVRVAPDTEDNLIHTYRLDEFPANEQVLVTVTSLVARRERRAPEGEFPIPEPGSYPAEVRPYLSATEMVAADHPEIQAEAEEIMAETRDAYGVALELARRMRRRGYKPDAEWDQSVPTAVFVLRHGASCCASAVSAAAVLRACGIPTQLTYASAGYIHGIIQFYLNGHGWVRMDATCGTGRLPLVQQAEDLGLVRLFDMPIEMERIWHAYAWPYHNTDAVGDYRFSAGGQACNAVRFAHKGAPGPDGVAGRVADPFPHLESGSWNRVLGSAPLAGAWESWDTLAEASKAAVLAGTVGEFERVTARLPALSRYIAEGRDFGKSEG